MGATNSFSEAAWELQMAFPKPLRSVHRIPGGFRKAIFSSHAALEQPLALQQEGLGKSVKILKNFERDKVR
jgi:hypothetical protein